MIRFTFVHALFLCALLSLGCEQSKPHTPSPSSTQAPSPVPKELSSKQTSPPSSTRIKASSKRLPQTPKRIISLAPNITEILFALGVGDRVVGVTTFCDHPQQVSALPKVGGFNQPDMETVVGLTPDLILGMASGPTKTLPAKLDTFKVPYVFTQMDTIAQTYEGIEVLGDIVGRPEQARTLVATMKKQLVKAPRTARSPSTLFVLGHKPMIVASTGTFGAELIELAGGRVAFSNGNPYPTIDMELVLKLSPEIIVDTTMTPVATTQAFWAKHKSIRAVQHKRVYTLSDPALLRPGPRLVDAHRRMTSLISPELQSPPTDKEAGP